MTLDLVPFRGHTVPVLGGGGEISRLSQQEYLNWLSNWWTAAGAQQPPFITTYGTRAAEPISASFEGFVTGMLYADGPVAAAEGYRLRVFGQAPLLYQELVGGRPGDLFDDDALERLREPWPGGNLGDLMKRALIYGDFAGNAFVLDFDDELVLVRPDWVEIVLDKREFRGGQVGWRQIGIIYYEGGLRSNDGVTFLPGEYCHFVPGLPDPMATYRGMSWLTPLVREVRSDKSAMDHKVAFFDNAATPNLAVSLPKEITPEQFLKFVDAMDEKHKGAVNAGRTLYTAGGADVTVVGANMQQMDFSAILGKSETRIANAAGVPPVLLSFSEGMQGSSLNAGNYTAAKRNFVDTTMRDLWQNWAGSVQKMDAFRPPKAKSRLWYDGRDIPFLHEDAKDRAEIQQIEAATLSSHISAGWEPETAVDALLQDDLKRLKHTGLTSVQLVPPGTAEGSVEDEEAGEEYDALLDEFRSRPRDGEIVRKFNPDQPRIPGGHVGGGRWADVGIFTKIFKFGGQEVSVTAHADGDRTIAFGGRSVRLQRSELESRYDGPSSLRSLAYRVVDADVGDKLTVDRYSENYGPDGEVVSVAKRHAIGVRKLAEPPEIHPNGDPDEETWDLTPVSLHLPDDEGFVDEAGITMRQRDIVTLAEQANALVAERIDTPTGSVDVFRDGGKFTIRSARGPDLTFNRKSANALERAFDDLWDEEHRDERPSDVWAERVVSTNLGDVTVRMRGEAEEATLTVGGTTITIPKSAILEFGSALGEWTGSAYRSRLGWSEHDEIQRDRYNVRNPEGSVGGGRFRRLSDAIIALLRDSEGDDPLEDFTQPQLKKAATDLGLTEPRKRYTAKQLKLMLAQHARGRKSDDKPEAPAKAAPRRVRTQDLKLGTTLRDPETGEEAKVVAEGLRTVDIEWTDSAGRTHRRNNVLKQDIVDFNDRPAPAKKATPRAPAKKAAPKADANAQAKREMDAEEADERADGLYVPPRHPAMNTPYAAGKELDRSHDQDEADDALEGLTLVELRQVARDKGVTVSGRNAEAVRRQIVDGLTPKRPDWPPARERDPIALDRVLAQLARVDWAATEGVFADPARGLIDHLSLRERKDLAQRIGLPDGGLRSKPEWHDAIVAAFVRGDVDSDVMDEATERVRQAAALDEVATPDRESAARQRQADIDTAQNYAAVAGELAEYLDAEADPEVVARRLRQEGRKRGIADEVEPIAKAVESGDPDFARLRMENLLADHGITQDGAAGDSGRFTPSQHTPIGAPIRQGAAVEVVRPGFTLTRDGERIRLSKAVVEEAGEPAASVEPEPVHDGVDALYSVSISQSNLAAAEWNRQSKAELNELGLSDEDIAIANEALAAYQTGGEFERINRALESGDIDPETQARADAIQRVAEASPLLTDVIVWRGERNPPELAEGDTFRRKGFASTSGDQIYARQFAFETPTGATRGENPRPTLFRIRAPRGTPAIHLDALGEDEVLLGSGLQYHVTADHGVVDGVRRLDIEVVPASASSAPDPLSSLRTLDPEAARDALDLRTVAQLKDLIRQANERDGVKLPVSGRKRELVDRLVGHLHPGDSPTEARPANADDDAPSGPFRPVPTHPVTRDERIRALVATGMTWKQAREQVKRESPLGRSETPDKEGISRAEDEPEGDEAERADLNPTGDDDVFKRYWIYEEGRARWNTFTELVAHLVKHVSPSKAKRIAADWFHERYGFWPGDDRNRVRQGKPPRGDRIGPG